MKKLIVAVILCVCLAVPAFAQGKNESSNSKTSSDEKTSTIYLWTAWAPEAGMQEIVDKFMEKYPQITVELVQFSNNNDGNIKLDTTLLAGKGIDVFFNFGVNRVDARAKKNLMLDLTPYIARDGFDVATELGNSIYQYNDAYYSLPATSNAYCVWLNKSMLEEAGLKTPTSWTIDEFYEYARKLTKGSGQNKVYGADTLRPIDQWLFMATNTFPSNPWYDEQGLSNWTHPYYKEILQRKYQVENVDQIQFPYTDYKSTKVSTAANFMNEKTAMAIYGNSLARDLINTEKYPHTFAAEIAPLPTMNESDEQYNVGGYYGYLGINAKTKEPDASWLLLKYLVTEGSLGFIKVGHIPTWKGASQDEIVSRIFGSTPEKFVNIEQFKDVVLNPPPQQEISNFTAREQMLSALETQLENYIFDLTDIDTALANAKSASDAEIQRNR